MLTSHITMFLQKKHLYVFCVADWLLAKIKKRHVSFYEDSARPGRLLPTTLGATRRTCAPLDIVGLPKYDQLSIEERQLCSEHRGLPQIYLEIKQIMAQECLKHDGLRLADIRPLVKIDVNKTRKLYDYFLQRELIYMPVIAKTTTEQPTEHNQI